MPSRRGVPRQQKRNAGSARQRKRERKPGRTGKLFEKLVALQKQLRAPNGCPWDREQTHQSLRPFLIEEAYEVLDALDEDNAQKFAGELGDLLLQIVFHAELAKEGRQFDIDDVIETVHSKMVRRHPHVFGKSKAATSAEVLKNWEEIKAEERRGEANGGAASGKRRFHSVLDGVPRGLPALLEGYQLTRRASNVGFDWDDVEGIVEKIREEIQEVREALKRNERGAVKSSLELEAEIGDLIFSAVNLARFTGIDPERAVKRANQKFSQRFHWMEERAQEHKRRLADLPRAEMEELWNESKVRA